MRQALLAVLIFLVPVLAGAEVVRIDRDGLTLNANLERAAADWTAGPVVLMVHGTLAYRGMEIMATLQSLLAERHISSLAINLSLGIDDRPAAMYDCTTPHRHKHTDAVGEIGAWMAWLQEQGARHIALLGHSRGGNQVARFAAAADAPDLTAVFLVAPQTRDGELEAQAYRKRYGTSLQTLLDRARRQVAAGKGAELMDHVDFLHCKDTRATADTVLSYYAPDEDMDTPHLLERIRAPVIVFAGTEDEVEPGLIDKVKPLDGDGHIRLAVIDGAGHFFRDLYAEDVADIIAARLGKD